jgi:hypothetical protein
MSHSLPKLGRVLEFYPYSTESQRGQILEIQELISPFASDPELGHSTLMWKARLSSM